MPSKVRTFRAITGRPYERSGLVGAWDTVTEDKRRLNNGLGPRQTPGVIHEEKVPRPERCARVSVASFSVSPVPRRGLRVLEPRNEHRAFSIGSPYTGSFQCRRVEAAERTSDTIFFFWRRMSKQAVNNKQDHVSPPEGRLDETEETVNGNKKLRTWRKTNWGCARATRPRRMDAGERFCRAGSSISRRCASVHPHAWR